MKFLDIHTVKEEAKQDSFQTDTDNVNRKGKKIAYDLFTHKRTV